MAGDVLGLGRDENNQIHFQKPLELGVELPARSLWILVEDLLGRHDLVSPFHDVAAVKHDLRANAIFLNHGNFGPISPSARRRRYFPVR